MVWWYSKAVEPAHRHLATAAPARCCSILTSEKPRRQPPTMARASHCKEAAGYRQVARRPHPPWWEVEYASTVGQRVVPLFRKWLTTSCGPAVSKGAHDLSPPSPSDSLSVSTRNFEASASLLFSPPAGCSPAAPPPPDFLQPPFLIFVLPPVEGAASPEIAPGCDFPPLGMCICINCCWFGAAIPPFWKGPR